MNNGLKEKLGAKGLATLGLIFITFLAASAAHFPPSGTIPPEMFLNKPQYNTWIELVYDQNQEDVLKYAHGIVDNGFPPGILMIDDNWQKYYGSTEFRPDRFPDPKGMVDELHALGFKVMLWICPFVSPDSQEYRMLRDKGYLVTRHPGLVERAQRLLRPEQSGGLRVFQGDIDRLAGKVRD